MGDKTGCVGMLLKLLGIAGKPPEARPLPYKLRDDFLSPAEVSFYHVLRQAVGERATVCAKVRLADLFFVARPNENATARNRIAAKHVDFLLCDPATMRPRACIAVGVARTGGRDALFSPANPRQIRPKSKPAYPVCCQR